MKNIFLNLVNDRVDTYVNDAKAIGSENHVNFRHLLGEAAWKKLVPAVQERFSSRHTEVITYIGSMDVVEANVPGRLLAQLCRLLGTPLTPYIGCKIPTRVRVYTDVQRKGTIWEREYRFPAKDPITIRSLKCLDKDSSLMESVDGGVRMRLRVYEEDGRLIFASTGYFLELLGFRIPLPKCLAPGETKVIHQDLGAGDFRFTLIMKHGLFGRLFYQSGIFRLEE